MARGGFNGGLARLNNKLTRTIPRAAKAAAQRAVIEGAHTVAELQYSLAPVDDGDLRNSIEVTPPGSMTPPYSHPGGSQMAREGQALITAGNTDVRYAHLVEYGTIKTPAQPYFWPAWRSLRTRVKGNVTRSIKKAVTAAAKGEAHWGTWK